MVIFLQNFENFFWQSRPRYSPQNFIPDEGRWSPYDAIDILTATLNVFEKFGDKHFGGGPPRNPWLRYDAIRYIYVCSKADNMARLV